jgi:hypothetical protein
MIEEVASLHRCMKKWEFFALANVCFKIHSASFLDTELTYFLLSTLTTVVPK